MTTWDDSVLLTPDFYASWLCSSICFWLFHICTDVGPRSRPKPLLPLCFPSNHRLLVKAELNWRWRKERPQYAIACRQFNVIVLFSIPFHPSHSQQFFKKRPCCPCSSQLTVSWILLCPPSSISLPYFTSFRNKRRSSWSLVWSSMTIILVALVSADTLAFIIFFYFQFIFLHVGQLLLL